MVTRSEMPSPATAPGAGAAYRPDVDVCDRGTEVVLTADMPGAKADSIDVTFNDGVLALHASVAPRGSAGRPLRQEYGVGSYRRSFRLGEGFDGSRIAAEYRKGVLSVRIPRLAAVVPRKVEVRAG